MKIISRLHSTNKHQRTYVERQLHRGRKQFSKFIPIELYDILQNVTNQEDRIEELIAILEKFLIRKDNDSIKVEAPVQELCFPPTIAGITSELTSTEKEYLRKSVSELAQQKLSERKGADFLYSRYKIYSLGRGINKGNRVPISRKTVRILLCLVERNYILLPSTDFLAKVEECRTVVEQTIR